MGKLISRLAIEDEKIKIVSALDIENIGKKLDEIVPSSKKCEIIIKDIKNLKMVINETNPDVAVDFTLAPATKMNCPILLKNNIRCVIGTTGLNEEFINKIEKSVKEHKAPTVLSPNMSTGMNVFFELTKLLAKHLSDWDIEIIETHHHRKQDSPSGTALKIGQQIAKELGVAFEDVAKFGRGYGPNKRKVGAKKEIGIHAVRAGDIVGDHLVLYVGKGERIELKHQVYNRECFAEGAIKAIKFIINAQENKIYTTKEVLDI
jgi:4-hydroxy-tetrahydrodipicolinate reductase